MPSDSQELLLRIRAIADLKDAAAAQAAVKALHAEVAKPVKGGLAGLGETLRDMRAAFQGSGGGVDGVLNALAAGGTKAALALSATATVAMVAKHSIDEFAQAQERVAKLDAALAQNGLLTEDLREKYQGLAAELQHATGVADDEWIGVLTRLTQFGSKPETIGVDAEAVKNLAGLMGGDVTAAANAYSRALQGNFEMFRRYGIEVQDAGTQTEKLAQLQEQAARRGGGQLEAANQTINGQWRAMKNNANDLFEAMGRLASGTGVLQTGTGALSTAFKYWADALGGTVPKVAGLKNSLDGAARSEADAAKAAEDLKTAQEALATSIETTNRALQTELGLMDAEAAAADKVAQAQLKKAIAQIKARDDLSPAEKERAIAIAQGATEKEAEQRAIKLQEDKRDKLLAAEEAAKADVGKAQKAVGEAKERLKGEKDVSEAKRAERAAAAAIKDQQEQDRAKMEEARAGGANLSPAALANLEADQAKEIARLEARRQQAAGVVAQREAAFKERFGTASIGLGPASDQLKALEAAQKLQEERVAKESPARQAELQRLNIDIGGARTAAEANEFARRQERVTAAQGPGVFVPEPQPFRPPAPVRTEGPSADSFTGTQIGTEATKRMIDEANRIAAAMNGAADAQRRIAEAAEGLAAATADSEEAIIQALIDAETRRNNGRG